MEYYPALLHTDSLTFDFLGIGLMERYWKTGEESGPILIPPLSQCLHLTEVWILAGSLFGHWSFKAAPFLARFFSN